MMDNDMSTESNSILEKIGGIKVLVVGILAIAIIATVIIHFMAQDEAEDELRKNLRKYELYDLVDYNDVSYNIFSGTLTVSDITVYADQTKIGRTQLLSKNLEIDQVILRNFVDDGDITELDISIDGLYVSVMDQKNRRDPLNFMYKPMSEGHYLETKLSIDLISESDEDGDGQVEMVFSASDMMSFGFNFAFESMENPEEYMSRALPLLVSGNAKNLTRSMDSLPRFDFSSFSAFYQDEGFVKRMKSVKIKQSVNDYSVSAEDYEFDYENDAHKLSAGLVGSGFPEDLADDLTDAITDFVKNPNFIGIEIEADDPLDVGKELLRIQRSGSMDDIFEEIDISVNT